MDLFELDTRENPLNLCGKQSPGRATSVFWPDRVDLGLVPGFSDGSSPRYPAFVENQAVEVVGEIGERQFHISPNNADGSDEQARVNPQVPRRRTIRA